MITRFKTICTSIRNHPDFILILFFITPVISAFFSAAWTGLIVCFLGFICPQSAVIVVLPASFKFVSLDLFWGLVFFPFWVLKSLSCIPFIIANDFFCQVFPASVSGYFVDLSRFFIDLVLGTWWKLFFSTLDVIGFGFQYLSVCLQMYESPSRFRFGFANHIVFYFPDGFFSNDMDFFSRLNGDYYSPLIFNAFVGSLLFLGAIFFTVLGILLSIAYLTVLERKVLGGVQRREGPTQVGPIGLFQAIADALKLLSKENLSPSSSNKIVFFLFPTLIFVFSLFIWPMIPMLPNDNPPIEVNLFYLLIFALSTIHVYLLALSAWSGVSRYPFTGSVRTVAQMLSYDVVLALALAPAMVLAKTINPLELVEYQYHSAWLVFQIPVSCALVSIVSLAETNRPPFDLPEAESELVAGGLTEYSSTNFVFFFIAEYSHILLSCHILVLTFLGGWHFPFFDPFTWLVDQGIPHFFLKFASFLFYQLKLLLVMLLFFMARSSLPRYRYDQLMDLSWKRLLPIALGQIVFVVLLINIPIVGDD